MHYSQTDIETVFGILGFLLAFFNASMKPLIAPMVLFVFFSSIASFDETIDGAPRRPSVKPMIVLAVDMIVFCCRLVAELWQTYTALKGKLQISSVASIK